MSSENEELLSLDHFFSPLQTPRSYGKSDIQAHKVSLDGKKKKNFKTIRKDICAVCLNEENIDTMLLPCGHVFHGQCIIQWVKQNFNCPLCRQEIAQFIPLGYKNNDIMKEFVQIWNEHYLGLASKKSKLLKSISSSSTHVPETCNNGDKILVLSSPYNKTVSNHDLNLDIVKNNITLIQQDQKNESQQSIFNFPTSSSPNDSIIDETAKQDQQYEKKQEHFDRKIEQQPEIQNVLSILEPKFPVEFENDEKSLVIIQDEYSSNISPSSVISISPLTIVKKNEPLWGKLWNHILIVKPVVNKHNAAKLQLYTFLNGHLITLRINYDYNQFDYLPNLNKTNKCYNLESFSIPSTFNYNVHELTNQIRLNLNAMVNGLYSFVQIPFNLLSINSNTKKASENNVKDYENKNTKEAINDLFKNDSWINLKSGACGGLFGGIASVLLSKSISFNNINRKLFVPNSHLLNEFFPVLRETAPSVAIFFTIYEQLKNHTFYCDPINKPMMQNFGERFLAAGIASTFAYLPKTAKALTFLFPLRNAIFFSSFELIKDIQSNYINNNNNNNNNTKLNFLQVSSSAGFGGIIASSIYYPMSKLSNTTNLQRTIPLSLNYNVNKNVFTSAFTISNLIQITPTSVLQQSKLLYRGWLPHLVKFLPPCITCSCIFEYSKRYFTS